MNIPDKALDAAVKALFDDGCGEPKVDASTALEAAYKFIAAQTLRDADKSIVLEQFSPTEHGSLIVVKEELRYRADELDPQ